MSDRRGQTLVLAYVTVVVLTLLGGSLFNHGLTFHHHSQIQQFETEAFYLAEGGLEDAVAQFSQALANFQISPTISRYPVTGSLTTTYAPSVVFPAGAVASTVITEIQPGQQTVADPDGTNIFVKQYRVTTTVQHPLNSTTIATLDQIMTRRIIYTFQHAIFYDGDLEWLPGPPMTLSGRVHSNSDMYLGANNELIVDNEYLRSAGSIYNRRKDNGTVPPGDVEIKKAGTGAFIAMAGVDSTHPSWATLSQQMWNGTVQSSVHGVTQLAVPVVGSIQPGGFYDTNADVRVVDMTVTQGGVALVEGVDIPVGTVMVSTTFYNHREGKWIQMMNLDLKKLAGYNNPTDIAPSFPNHLPSNGLLHATITGTPPTNQPGIRLLNGKEIFRNEGLTVVSDDPVYVQGNFNNVSKKPVAVIADAVNLLSNNWNDANSNQSLSNRNATPTTVNSAFIAGITTTTPGQYNGGLENYPRFHEDWTGDTLSITGSFVSLWNSQIATGKWCYGTNNCSPYANSNQYKAPIRNWNYDTSFSSGNVPPFTPWAVEIINGAWWKE